MDTNKKDKKVSANSTPCSQAVTHPSTDEARRCLTSVIGREPVRSAWYGRWQENWPDISIMTPVQFDLTKTSDGQHQMALGKRHWPKVELLRCFSKTKSCNGNISYKKNFANTEKCVSQSSKWGWPVLGIELESVTFSGIAGFPPRATVWKLLIRHTYLA